ncbi:hypothetical protein B0H67DRAFT_664932 [Lasiosphaeris hirsuta]|uniref:Uncharacterized protein n=1 Tax=Lasiosphaeris hirsuta TaxID=260670 RepID=A0AA40DVU0_9PEZI|nr:hypothetical protein B0H67DRAFT_664932 [Lasiosphaeris hirsuta]
MFVGLLRMLQSLMAQVFLQLGAEIRLGQDQEQGLEPDDSSEDSGSQAPGLERTLLAMHIFREALKTALDAGTITITCLNPGYMCEPGLSEIMFAMPSFDQETSGQLIDIRHDTKSPYSENYEKYKRALDNTALNIYNKESNVTRGFKIHPFGNVVYEISESHKVRNENAGMAANRRWIPLAFYCRSEMPPLGDAQYDTEFFTGPVGMVNSLTAQLLIQTGATVSISAGDYGLLAARGNRTPSLEAALRVLRWALGSVARNRMAEVVLCMVAHYEQFDSDSQPGSSKLLTIVKDFDEIISGNLPELNGLLFKLLITSPPGTAKVQRKRGMVSAEEVLNRWRWLIDH